MNDGLLVPSNADGMACFKGKNDRLILIRNHEIGHVPNIQNIFVKNPYGDEIKKYIRKNGKNFYDIYQDKTQCFGGRCSKS